ncbi:MAG: NAD(P)-binding protein, partial [Candidatus Aenigmarchaeota archaeon]|nr:NAD(P)-binding protein [Candidatus Aenigmarchaeota archaeon]
MKVGIVGCGIAGGYLAYRLSKYHDVTVFEHKKKIGKKACSGLVSERLWDFIPKNEKLVKHRIRKIIIHFPKKDIELIMDPAMMVLDHDKLDQYVASLGKAKILLNKHVTDVSGRTIKADGKEYDFDYIIGADGPMSIVRKSINGKTPKFLLGAFVYDKNDKDKKSNIVETWPLKNGFAWKIPRGDKVEYGVMEDPKIAMRELKKIYKKKTNE